MTIPKNVSAQMVLLVIVLLSALGVVGVVLIFVFGGAEAGTTALSVLTFLGPTIAALLAYKVSIETKQDTQETKAVVIDTKKDLVVVHDLVNSKSEELKSEIAKASFAEGKEAGVKEERKDASNAPRDRRIGDSE